MADDRKGPDGLNARQRLFVANYLQHFNAAKAARDAGYSEDTAREQGYRLLTNVHIRTAISEGQARFLSDAGVSLARIIREYSRIAFADLGDLASWDDGGNVTWVASDALPEGFTAAVSEFTQRVTVTRSKNGDSDTRTEIKAKLLDKQKALDKLMEYVNGADLDDEDGDGPANRVVFKRGAPSA